MLDNFITTVDKFINTIFGEPSSVRPHPDAKILECELSDRDKKHTIGLMRINHCGEICAQALYQGQALTSKSQATKMALQKAANEENEHLAWTSTRINELGGKTSLLNPLFYCGSLALGITAGLCGDKWSLGFLEETEKQVEAHLGNHLEEVHPDDEKTKAILTQMKIDENAHAKMAHKEGAAILPAPIKSLMGVFSKIMTKTTYYI